MLPGLCQNYRKVSFLQSRQKTIAFPLDMAGIRWNSESSAPSCRKSRHGVTKRSCPWQPPGAGGSLISRRWFPGAVNIHPQGLSPEAPGFGNVTVPRAAPCSHGGWGEGGEGEGALVKPSPY